jgi:hypothetical protein
MSFHWEDKELAKIKEFMGPNELIEIQKMEKDFKDRVLIEVAKM